MRPLASVKVTEGMAQKFSAVLPLDEHRLASILPRQLSFSLMST
jgi:hypothetical protein